MCVCVPKVRTWYWYIYDFEFLSSKLIKDKSDRKSTSEFVALILILNEKGMLKNFALTKTEGLKELKPLLKSIKSKSPGIESIASGIIFHTIVLGIG